MLVDPEWIDIFERNRVRVGVSLDGPAEYNDKARVDFRGRGTTTPLSAACGYFRLGSRGAPQQGWVLCVIDPAYPARTIYRYFVDELGVKYMDFLLRISPTRRSRGARQTMAISCASVR